MRVRGSITPRRLATGMLLGFLLLTGCGGNEHGPRSTVASAPWFAGYVDITVPSTYEVDEPPTPAAAKAVLSFIVAAEEDPCEPSWGGVYSLDRAGDALGLDDRLSRLREDGGEAVVSFGGQLGSELAATCADPEHLASAYAEVIDRYGITTIDLDIEGDDLDDSSAGIRRAEVIAGLQSDRADGEELRVWVTLPVTPDGLTGRGQEAVAQLLDAEVQLAGVNIMTMNYSQSRMADQTMVEASRQAADSAHSQLAALYRDRGEDLGADEVWNRIGLTPMIGSNDVPGEVIDLDAARELNEFALDRGVGRMSLWSLNRDRSCGPDDPGTAQASNTCSGLDQEPGAFADVLGNGFSGTSN